MRLVERNEPGNLVWATTAHLSWEMIQSADLASPARFADHRFMRAWLDILSCKLGAKAKQQLTCINTLEPIGVPT